MRRGAREARKRARPKQQEWNPATYFILIFLLIGSNAIHFVNLKRQYTISSRQADTKIALLREVLKRVQNGEDIDVERALGTGDPLAEQEWHEGKTYQGQEAKHPSSNLLPGLSPAKYRRGGPDVASQGEEKEKTRG